MADAGEHDHKHSKRGRLQQQAQAGGLGDKARRKQHAEHGHKKIGPADDGGRPLKSEPTKRPPLKPDPQSCNGRTKPETAEESAL